MPALLQQSQPFSVHKTIMTLQSTLITVNPLTPDQICNSPYCQPYNSYNVSSENLVFNQLIIPKLTYFFILITNLVEILLIL